MRTGRCVVASVRGRCVPRMSMGCGATLSMKVVTAMSAWSARLVFKVLSKLCARARELTVAQATRCQSRGTGRGVPGGHLGHPGRRTGNGPGTVRVGDAQHAGSAVLQNAPLLIATVV